MQKTTKRNLIIILFLLFISFFSAFVICSSFVPVNADTSVDDVYQFSNNLEYHYTEIDDERKDVITLKLYSLDKLFNTRDGGPEYSLSSPYFYNNICVYNWWGTFSPAHFTFKFSLHRNFGGSTGDVILFTDVYNFEVKNTTYGTSMDSLYSHNRTNTSLLWDTDTEDLILKNDVNIHTTLFEYFSNSGNQSYLEFDILTKSPDSLYSVSFDLEFEYLFYCGFFNNTNNSYSTSCKSLEYSCSKILDELLISHDLSDIYSDDVEYERAFSIEHVDLKHIRLYYLIPIRDSSFAIQVYFDGDFEFIDGKLSLEHVESIIDDFESVVFGSFVDKFEPKSNKEDTYITKYHSSKYLRTMDSNGDFHDYILDLNQSFKDYYDPYTEFETGSYQPLLTDELLSFEFNEIIVSNNLDDYFLNGLALTYDNVYGYWAFFVMPKVQDVDSFLKLVTGRRTSYTGLCGYCQYDIYSVSLEAYNSFSAYYNNGFGKTIFTGLTNLLTGQSALSISCYFVYMDKNFTYSLVGEGGQTEYDDGSISGDLINEQYDNVTGLFNIILNGTGNFLTNGFEILSSSSFLKILLILVVVLFVVFLVIKLFGRRKK